MKDFSLWEILTRAGLMAAVLGFGLSLLPMGRVLLIVGVVLLAVGAAGTAWQRGGLGALGLTLWDCAGVLGTLAVMAGLMLTVLRYPAGRYVLLGGAAAAVVGMIGGMGRAIRHPLRCPACGAVLRGSRVRISGLLRKTSDMITCGACGARVDLLELYREQNSRRR